MCVRVYSGNVLVEEMKCNTQAQALKIAAYWQDNGYRVRIS